MSDANKRLRQLAGMDRFLAHIGAHWVDDPEGRVALGLTVAQHHLNKHDTCHGGVIFALADAAFGIASNAHEHVSLAIDAHITFSAAVREGDAIKATVTELTRTRRIGTYRVDVTKDGGEPVSQFTGTVYITEKPVSV